MTVSGGHRTAKSRKVRDPKGEGPSKRGQSAYNQHISEAWKTAKVQKVYKKAFEETGDRKKAFVLAGIEARKGYVKKAGAKKAGAKKSSSRKSK
jgi:hypothetical protein